MAKIFGGSASRLEVYALFVAAVVLIGGGIGGAIVVTSSDSKPAEVAQVSVDTTVVDTTGVPATPEIGPPAAENPGPATTQAQRQNNPQPLPTPTTAPPAMVPVQDWMTFCVMPNLVGLSLYAHYDESTVSNAMKAAGCSLPFAKPTAWCVDASLASQTAICCGGRGRVRTQTPTAGTLVHRTLGTYSYSVGWYPERPQGDTTGTAPPSGFIFGTNPC